jgi:NADH-quinone oxidoreductase subunit J
MHAYAQPGCDLVIGPARPAASQHLSGVRKARNRSRGRRRTVESGRPLASVAGSRCALEKLPRERSTLDITGILFFVLAIGVVGAGLAVVTLRNVIHSAIAMMVCFGALAGMYALLGAPIVAAAQVLIYLGAISVLIIFAIMLTQAGDASLPAPFHRQVPLAALAALLVVGLIGWAVIQTDWGTATAAVAVGLEAVATALFTDYALPFEIISLLLLAAIIGAIYLARRPEEDERVG